MTNRKFKFRNIKKIVNRTIKLSELPPNIGTPEYFFKNIKGLINEEPWEDYTLLDAVDCHGSMGIIEHIPVKPGKHRHTKPIVLVGKGLCFDSGGLNIKTSDMHEMKFDKCGAMSVIAVLEACKKHDYPCPVIGIVPLAENLVGTNVTKPGSVIQTNIKLRKKSTYEKVEVVDTDAEGRLVLADALHLAKLYDPAAVISVATLTGGCAYALGDTYSGMFNNKQGEDLAAYILDLSADTDDLVWRMPIHKNHLDNLRTHMANIKNYHGKETGGSSAAAFLQYFVDGAYPWVHLDIAGTAWKGECATGRPTSLILKYLESIV